MEVSRAGSKLFLKLPGGAFNGDADAEAAIEGYAGYILKPIEAFESITTGAATAISITYDAVTNSINTGAIQNEVTQVILTPGTSLGELGDPRNADRWRPYSHASTNSGPGNSNAVFYMENQALPVLGARSRPTSIRPSS